MCGICGFDGAGATDTTLRRMNARLRHRGPDEEGYYTSGGAGLAVRRLRVIDPAGGSQPIANEDGTIRVVFNGEIYNFRELRARLVARGHTFRSRADTEVLVHGYEEWGEDVVHHLQGMFAFAIHDERDGSWFLARDRLGQKPLYFHHGERAFVFASQPAALLEHPLVQRRVDTAALAAYLAFEYVPSPASLFDGIRKLPPGHLLRVRDGRLAVATYWRFPARREAEARTPPPGRGSDADWTAGLRSKLGAAVERRLVSDVPLGCFLSGGLDSSAIAVLMAERMEARVQTFAIGFTDPSFDESEHAARVARHIGAEHHVQVLDARSILELLHDVAEFMDEPLGDGSVLPTYALARFARAHVTVVLSGDGGDELLGGYPTLFADGWANLYTRAVSDTAHRLLAGIAGGLPVSHSDMSLDFKIRQFLRGARLPSDVRHFAWVGSFLPREIRRLLRPVVRRAADPSPYDVVIRDLQQGPLREGLDRLLYLYARYYLAEDVLVKVDRATMASSLEARSPFLDPAVVEFCAAMPNRLKVRGHNTKVALRRAFAGDLPPSILARPKKGFGMPVGQWLRGPLRGLMSDLLGERRLRQQGLFEPRVVLRMRRRHEEGRADFRKQLWTLLAFQLWYRHHLEVG